MGGLTKRFPIYSRFLKLYPLAHQKEYAEQMLQTLADMLDHAETRGERLTIWISATIDLSLSVTKQRLITAGSIMGHETPNYIKWNAIVGAALIVPFFAIIIANSLSNRVLANFNGNRGFFIFLLIVL